MKVCPNCQAVLEDSASFCPFDGHRLLSDRPEVSIIGSTLAGRYRVERKLGQGCAGTVYVATDDQDARTVAVRILNPALDPASPLVDRLISDARAATQLANPHMIPLLDSGIHVDRFVFLVEPLLDRNLSMRLAAHGAVTPSHACRIAREMLSALGALHRIGLLHLNLKPANIFLVRDPLGMDRAVLSGVGTHHALGLENAGRGVDGACQARAEYLAPEIVGARGADGRTDIYFLGLLLYELLTERPPFTGSNFATTAKRHVYEKPLSVRLLRPQSNIPTALETFVLRCLAKDPNARHGSTAEALTALDRVEQHVRDESPTQAPSPPSAFPFSPSSHSTGGSGAAQLTPESPSIRYPPSQTDPGMGHPPSRGGELGNQGEMKDPLAQGLPPMDSGATPSSPLSVAAPGMLGSQPTPMEVPTHSSCLLDETPTPVSDSGPFSTGFASPQATAAARDPHPSIAAVPARPSGLVGERSFATATAESFPAFSHFQDVDRAALQPPSPYDEPTDVSQPTPGAFEQWPRSDGVPLADRPDESPLLGDPAEQIDRIGHGPLNDVAVADAYPGHHRSDAPDSSSVQSGPVYGARAGSEAHTEEPFRLDTATPIETSLTPPVTLSTPPPGTEPGVPAESTQPGASLEYTLHDVVEQRSGVEPAGAIGPIEADLADGVELLNPEFGVDTVRARDTEALPIVPFLPETEPPPNDLSAVDTPFTGSPADLVPPDSSPELRDATQRDVDDAGSPAVDPGDATWGSDSDALVQQDAGSFDSTTTTTSAPTVDDDNMGRAVDVPEPDTRPDTATVDRSRTTAELTSRDRRAAPDGHATSGGDLTLSDEKVPATENAQAADPAVDAPPATQSAREPEEATVAGSEVAGELDEAVARQSAGSSDNVVTEPTGAADGQGQATTQNRDLESQSSATDSAIGRGEKADTGDTPGSKTAQAESAKEDLDQKARKRKKGKKGKRGRKEARDESQGISVSSAKRPTRTESAATESHDPGVSPPARSSKRASAAAAPPDRRTAFESGSMPAASPRADDWFVETTDQLEAKHAQLTEYHFHQEPDRNLFPYVMAVLAVLIGGTVWYIYPKSTDAPAAVESGSEDTTQAVAEPAAAPTSRKSAADLKAHEEAARRQRIAQLEASARDARRAKRWQGSPDSLFPLLEQLRDIAPESPIIRSLERSAVHDIMEDADRAQHEGDLTAAQAALVNASAFAREDPRLNTRLRARLDALRALERPAAPEEVPAPDKTGVGPTDEEPETPTPAAARVAAAAMPIPGAEATLPSPATPARPAPKTKPTPPATRPRPPALDQNAAATARRRRAAVAQKAEAERVRKNAARNHAAQAAKKAAASRKQEARQRATTLVSEGRVHVRNARWSDARKAFTKAVELNTSSAPAYAGLADVAFQERKFQVSLRHNQRSVALSPRNASYQVNLGMSYFKLKRYDEAKARWERALVLAPNNAKASKYLKLANKKLGQ